MTPFWFIKSVDSTKTLSIRDNIYRIQRQNMHGGQFNCANNNVHRNIKHDNVHVYVYIVWLTSHSYIMCFSANKELNWIEHGT